MKTIESGRDMRGLSRDWRAQHKAVGFVPTMGALHRGHLSLLSRARESTDRTVVSIFVNPTQFNNSGDLASYPRTLDADLALLKSADVDAVFVPNATEIYADGYNFTIQEKSLSQMLCGPARPGHFDGMLTVVLKLLNLVSPQKAFFGEKDYQQLKLIQEMAKALFLESEIVGCPTVREDDGLAMSSRNLLLSEAERRKAAQLYHVLKSAASAEEARQQLTHAGFKVDYVEEHWGRRFAAAFLGTVRLIDNVAL